MGGLLFRFTGRYYRRIYYLEQTFAQNRPKWAFQTSNCGLWVAMQVGRDVPGVSLNLRWEIVYSAMYVGPT